jgi:hypothetical protein
MYSDSAQTTQLFELSGGLHRVELTHQGMPTSSSPCSPRPHRNTVDRRDVVKKGVS